MNRRDYLQGMALFGAAACTAPLNKTAAPSVSQSSTNLPSTSQPSTNQPAAKLGNRSVQDIGLQLYTVRDEMAKDVPATLAAVAEAGYSEVETAGTGNLTPLQFARALADVGLNAPAAHVPLNLMAEQPEALLKTAQTVGYQYLVVPWLPPEMRTIEGYGKTIDVLNGFGETSAREGMQTCYHNHDFEFATVDGVVPMQLLLQQCQPELVRFELDLFWAAHAGADAAAYLSNDPDRFPLCHVKDRNTAGDMVDVGEGEIDFASLFAAGAGLKHYFVEHDRPTNSLASVTRSIAAVRRIRF